MVSSQYRSGGGGSVAGSTTAGQYAPSGATGGSQIAASHGGLQVAGSTNGGEYSPAAFAGHAASVAGMPCHNPLVTADHHSTASYGMAAMGEYVA